MRSRHARAAGSAGFSLFEALIAAGILAVVSASAVFFLLTEWRQDALDRDREFANDRAGDTTDILKMPSYDLVEFMAAFHTAHWRYQLNVYNVLDDVFAFTSVNRNNIWPSEPRNFRLSAGFRF